MLKFDDKGLIPAIVQDARNDEVLMLGYMNEESLRRTLASGDVWFYSRSRQGLWHKGETSGNFLRLKSRYVTLVTVPASSGNWRVKTQRSRWWNNPHSNVVQCGVLFNPQTMPQAILKPHWAGQWYNWPNR